MTHKQRVPDPTPAEIEDRKLLFLLAKQKAGEGINPERSEGGRHYYGVFRAKEVVMTPIDSSVGVT